MKTIFKQVTLVKISALVLATFITSTSIAAPRVTIQRQDYKINGSTFDEIRQAITKNAPDEVRDKNVSGLTKYDIAWNYTFDKSGKNCKIEKVTTSVVITQHLPKLENTNQLDFETQQKWNQYFSSLESHEKGHAELGIEAATEIEKEIADLRPSKTCSRLAIEANRLARTIINYYHGKNVDYDGETANGLLQGASLLSNKSFN
jgi:predicted secreted Zn-dependent protease